MSPITSRRLDETVIRNVRRPWFARLLGLEYRIELGKVVALYHSQGKVEVDWNGVCDLYDETDFTVNGVLKDGVE